MPRLISRSVYADRLGEFAGIAFAGETAFHHRGKWNALFQDRIGSSFGGRVIVEIGCSDADLLRRVAKKHPAIGFVGVDWKCKSLFLGAREIAKSGRANIALLNAHGQDIVRLFADGEVDEVWVLHPDPCDEDIELKNRLVAEPFLKDVHRVLRNGTSVMVLKTDHAGYYQSVLALLGREMPPEFQAARGLNAPSKIAMPSGNRLRVRDLMRPEELPKPSDAIHERFDVAIESADYWHDAEAQALTAERCFAGEKTAFERRFIAKQMPIFYMELRKKMDERDDYVGNFQSSETGPGRLGSPGSIRVSIGRRP